MLAIGLFKVISVIVMPYSACKHSQQRLTLADEALQKPPTRMNIKADEAKMQCFAMPSSWRSYAEGCHDSETAKVDAFRGCVLLVAAWLLHGRVSVPSLVVRLQKIQNPGSSHPHSPGLETSITAKLSFISLLLLHPCPSQTCLNIVPPSSTILDAQVREIQSVTTRCWWMCFEA